MSYNTHPSKLVLIVFCILFICPGSFGQTNQLDKKLETASEMLNDNKADDAEKYVLKILDDNPDYGDGWDLLGMIRYQQYLNSKSTEGITANFTISSKDEKGNDVKPENDSLMQQLSSLLKKISLPKMAFSKYMYTLRKATLMSREAWKSSAYLRIANVDVNVDSAVNKKALKYYQEAETEFAEKNYGKAATLYGRAIEEQPNFYKASMYMGDCYYATKDYTDAVTSFKNAKQKFPYLLEPSKYLTDAFAKLGLYDKALEEAIRSTTIYPDYSMLQKLEDIAYLNYQTVNIKWTQRGVFPNKITDTTNNDINQYSDKEDMKPEGPWKFYKAAYDKILPYCNNEGVIVKPNPLTKAKYLEVYSWEEMLKNSSDPILDEARRMQQANYLDCYVMISCFHYDLYGEYQEFARSNSDRIFAYFKAFTKAR